MTQVQSRANKKNSEAIGEPHKVPVWSEGKINLAVKAVKDQIEQGLVGEALVTYLKEVQTAIDEAEAEANKRNQQLILDLAAKLGQTVHFGYAKSSGIKHKTGERKGRATKEEMAERETALLTYLRGNPKTGAEQIKKELGWDKSDFISVVNKLKKGDKIKMQGAKRNATWSLA